MNIVIAGPCGVGKSTVAKPLAEQVQAEYLDFDEIRATKKNSIPCMLSRLNIIECLSSELALFKLGFVLDVGGGTVFRPNTDNVERMRQVRQLKNLYLARVVVLTADRDTLFKRYMNSKPDVSSKNENASYFENALSNWKVTEQPYWEQCAELTIDTTLLTGKDTIKMIENGLRV